MRKTKAQTLPILSINTRAGKEQPARPWIGSYFNIPQPEATPPAVKQPLIEWELQILLKDLTVKTVKMIGRNDGSGNQKEEQALSTIAWLDRDAVGFVVYESVFNEATGKWDRVEEPESHLGMRIGKYEWTWFEPTEGERDDRGGFIPACLKDKARGRSNDFFEDSI